MTIWSILCWICDAIKLSGWAAHFWRRHEEREADAISDKVQYMPHNVVIERLRSRYSA